MSEENDQKTRTESVDEWIKRGGAIRRFEAVKPTYRQTMKQKSGGKGYLKGSRK